MRNITIYIILCMFNISNVYTKEVLVDKRLKVFTLATNCKFIITSGYRTAKHNKIVGGARNSLHLVNKARDLVKTSQCNKTYLELGFIATRYFSGIIIYRNHLHVDVRENKIFIIK